MSSTIRSTIESVIAQQVGTVPSGYQRVVDEVVEAVESLALHAAESIRESASAAGIEGEQVESALVAAGLVEPEPVEETVTVSVVNEGTEARIAALEAAVASLREAARRHGVSI